MTKRIQALLETVQVSPAHPLHDPLRGWCARSRAFLAFAEANATKLRRKVRQASTQDIQRDLLCELAAAQGFLKGTHFAVRYEPFKAGGERSPDLQVVFKGHTEVNVEVTRLRPGAELDGAELDGSALTARLARVLCDKIGQFPGGAMNLLLVVVPAGLAPAGLAVEGLVAGLVAGAIRLLDQPPGGAALSAEAVRQFQRGRARLGAVTLGVLNDDGLQVAAIWLNGQAKHAVPPEVVKFLRGWGQESPPSG